MRKSTLVFCAVFILLILACNEKTDINEIDGDSTDSDIEDGDAENGDLADGDSEGNDSTDGDEPDDDSFLPATEPGPFGVGAFATVFSDPERGRELTGTVWYPTDVTEGDVIYYQGILPLGKAIKDAPITADPGPFPLVLFSHGHQAFDAQSFFLTEFLASHGYFVAACDHIEDTTSTQKDIYLVKSAIDRPQDVSLMIDTILQWNETPGHMLENRIDPEQIGVTGHSFGGYTAVAVLGPAFNMNEFLAKCEEMGEENWTGGWRFCEDILEADTSYADDCTPCNHKDDRIKASVPMTPALYASFAEGEIAKINVPMLLMAGEKDTTIPGDTEVYPFFELATHPNTIYWELEGAGHFTFSNMCQVLNLPQYGCGDAYTDPDIAYQRINTATLAYMNIFLRGDLRYWRYFEEEYLATAPEVTIERKSQP